MFFGEKGQKSSFRDLTFFGGEIGPKSIYMISRAHSGLQLRSGSPPPKLNIERARSHKPPKKRLKKKISTFGRKRSPPLDFFS